MVPGIINKMDALIHTHIGYNPEELLFRIGIAWRDNNMGRIGLEIQWHVHI
jgi:hypothetical protein